MLDETAHYALACYLTGCDDPRYFLVKAIAEQSGVTMPSFFGYLRYSLLVMGPIVLVTSLLCFL